MNVMFVFPPQSPDPPVMADRFHEPAPAPVISWKSALVTVTVAAVSVLAVPIVSEDISILLFAAFPFRVSVPLIV